MALEIRHLRAVSAIAEAGSLSRAATVLGMAQPSLTSLLQRLERHMGTPLFVRDHSGVTPTEVGEQMLRRARIVLVEFDQLAADLSGTAVPGPIRIGSCQMDCLPTFVARLDAAMPDVETTLEVDSSSSALAHALAHAHLDIAVVAMSDDQRYPLDRELGLRVVFPWIPVFVGLPAQHPLADRREVDLADLADESWISPPGPDDGSLASLRAAARRAGFEPRIRFTFPNGGGRQLIATGQAVQLVEPTAPELPGMVVRPLKDDPLRMRLVLAWRKERLTWDQAERVYRTVVAAYMQHAMAGAAFRTWWERNTELHSWATQVSSLS